MPIAGFTRFRQWAFSAAQSAHGTAGTPAAPAFPWRGTPTINPNWTAIDDVDVGSIDPVLNDYRTALETTATLEGPLDFNSIPLVMAGGLRGGVTATGGPAYTWAHQSLSTTATTLDEFTAQWGDDYATDDIRMKDGVIEKIEFSFADNLGPWRVSTQWYFGSTDTHVTRVQSLVVPSNLPLVFGADTALYIDSTVGGIGGTQISNALHAAKITITNTIDKKRFANGSNSRFAVTGYGLAARAIEAEFTFAKIDAIEGSASTSEFRNFLTATQTVRFLSVVTTSPEIITGSTPYSWTQRLGLNWTAKSDGEMGGNSTVTLHGRGRYTDLGYAYRSSVVNSNAALP